MENVSEIPFGFEMRLPVGGLTTDIKLRHWLVLIASQLLIFGSLAKRRDDVERMHETLHTPAKITIRISRMTIARPTMAPLFRLR